MFLNIFSMLVPPFRRAERVRSAENKIYETLTSNQHEFIEFALNNYTETGIDELNIDTLSKILKLKYGSLHTAQKKLGNMKTIRETFIDFQKHLYL